MTQNNAVHKTATDDAANRRMFLTALYGHCPDDLYLELRTIHPTTKSAKSLWGKIGHKSSLTTAFKQAEALNRDGYGLYFAPCLRQTKQGKAEDAALVPALWVDIDCEGDAAQREAGLIVLREFDFVPSFIIDSGGGWHAYWLLDQPFVLHTEVDRQKIAAILRGLFATLGGDDAYVKTVAGIMRLPGSINTKPERDEAVVRLFECHPDQHYPLDAFAWLESQGQPPPEKMKRGGAVIQDGHHPLPPRTQAYLASGTTEGHRNHELFAAACQLRDAGHSQADVERDLIPRYVADGCSETEGLRTIQSVYSRPAREPLAQPQPRETARDCITQLVKRYELTGQIAQRPSADEIRDAVSHCADLDPLAWAEERQRLRSVAGDTFRVDDLNRMYQHARRERERQEAPTSSVVGRYIEHETGLLYERQTDRGPVQQPITDWGGRVIEWISRIDDEGQEEHLMRLELRHPMHPITLEVPSELFGDAGALGRFIAQRAGGIYTVYPAMQRHLAKALMALSGVFPRRSIYRFFGWTRQNGQWIYLTPGVSVRADGPLTDAPEIELETRLRDYGLKITTWENSLRALTAVLAVFPPDLAPALTAFALLPLLQRFFPPAASRPALHLVGTTGSGKSEIAALMTSFYGHFYRDTPPAQWGDTINTVEVLGYALVDGLFWVDDWKSCYADEKTFVRFLQSYSRGMGRGRLTREARLRYERPCRGLLLSTGESTMDGEASILSRMLVLDIAPWEKRDPGGRRLVQAQSLQADLPGFTAHFARWIAAQLEAGTLTQYLAQRYEWHMQHYQDKLALVLGKQANTGRIMSHWAVLATTYEVLQRFLAEYQAEHLLPIWQDTIVQSAKAVQAERAGRLFMEALSQLLASGEIMLARNMQSPEEPRPGTTIVGYLDAQHVYLLPEVAHRAVLRVQALKFNVAAIGAQLKEEGWLIAGSSKLTIQRRIRGMPTRLWQIKADVLAEDDA